MACPIFQEAPCKQPYAHKPNRGIDGREQIEAPIETWEDEKPRAGDPGKEWWVLGVAELKLFAPRPRFCHVVLQWTCPQADDGNQRRDRNLGRQELHKPSAQRRGGTCACS